GAVSGIAVKAMAGLKYRQNLLRPEPVAQAERPLRIAEAKLDCPVDVSWNGDPLLCDLGAEIDDRGKHALRDEAGTVVDKRDRLAIGSKQGMCVVQTGWIRYRRAHQRAPTLPAENHIDG